jgi:hypothetical protein
MAEFEELRLTVSLTDNATAGLRALNTELEKLGAVAQKASVKNLADFAEMFRGASGQMLLLAAGVRDSFKSLSEFNRALLDTAKSTGLATDAGSSFRNVLFGIPALIAGIDVGLVKFSRSMIDLGNESRIAGMLPDRFKNITEQLEMFGYTEEGAREATINFQRTMREMAHFGTPEYERMLRESGATARGFATQLKAAIDRDDVGAAISAVAHRAQQIFAEAMATPDVSRAEATRRVMAMLKNFGLDMRAMGIEGDLVDQLIGKDPEKWARLVKAGVEFNAEWVKMKHVAYDALAGVQEAMMPFFKDLNKNIADSGEAWGKEIGEEIVKTIHAVEYLNKLLLRPYETLKEIWFTEIPKRDVLEALDPGLAERTYGPKKPAPALSEPAKPGPAPGEPAKPGPAPGESAKPGPEPPAPFRPPTPLQRLPLPPLMFAGPGAATGGGALPGPGGVAPGELDRFVAGLAGAHESANLIDRRDEVQKGQTYLAANTLELKRLADFLQSFTGMPPQPPQPAAFVGGGGTFGGQGATGGWPAPGGGAPTEGAPAAPGQPAASAATQPFSGGTAEVVGTPVSGRPGDVPSRFATVRLNNPGAMVGGQRAARFGGESGGRFAQFPNPVQGAAANMYNLSRSYSGMTVAGALLKWSGGGRTTAPGFDPNLVLTPELLQNPSFMIPFMQSVASGEAPGKQYPMDPAQWEQAFRMYMRGGVSGFNEPILRRGQHFATPPTGPGASLMPSNLGTGAISTLGAAAVLSGPEMPRFRTERNAEVERYIGFQRAMQGLDPEMRARIAAAYHDMPPDVRQSFIVNEGWRSFQYQQHLWETRSGRGMVARPGGSRHEGGGVFGRGQAIDVDRGAALDWLHAHGARYGLTGIGGDYPHIQMVPGGSSFVSQGWGGGWGSAPGGLAAGAVPFLTGMEPRSLNVRPPGEFPYWAETVDRTAIDRPMGREVWNKVEGTGKITVDVNALAESGGRSGFNASLLRRGIMDRLSQMVPAEMGPPEAVSRGGGDGGGGTGDGGYGGTMLGEGRGM